MEDLHREPLLLVLVELRIVLDGLNGVVEVERCLEIPTFAERIRSIRLLIGVRNKTAVAITTGG